MGTICGSSHSSEGALRSDAGQRRSTRLTYVVVVLAAVILLQPRIVLGKVAGGATSTFVVSVETGRVIAADRAETVRPLASLTKLATAMVLLDARVDLDGRSVVYNPKRHYAYRNWQNYAPGDVLRGRDLWYALLIGSQNIAARMLIDLTPYSEAEFIAKMQAKAISLGLVSTRFVDPHGLSTENVSTAAEVARLFDVALRYPDIRDALSRPAITIAMTGTDGAVRERTFSHTNILLEQWQQFATEASKTGYLDEAGDCLAQYIRNPQTGEHAIVVTLGEERVGARRRFDVARATAERVVHAPDVITAARAVLPAYLPLSSYATARNISVF